MAVTQKDIAEKLNVSVMTVSKSLKGHPDISPKTRNLVKRTAKKMNYTVNVVARSLVQQKTNTIGVVLPDISEQFYAEVLRSLENILRSHNYNILVADTNNDPGIEKNILRTMRENRIDGLIYCPTEKSEEYVRLLQDINIPYVLINIVPDQLICNSISVDRSIGADLAITHLLDRGYNDIYFFYTYKYMVQSRKSVEGCQKAFDKNKNPKSSLKMIYCENHELDTFYRLASEHLQFKGEKIGVFVWDDEMAIGVYRAIVEKGWDIPNQIGLVGFDDIKISKYLPRALTTIKYPKYEMGIRSAERLIQCLNSRRKLEPKKVILDLKLIKRETT